MRLPTGSVLAVAPIVILASVADVGAQDAKTERAAPVGIGLSVSKSIADLTKPVARPAARSARTKKPARREAASQTTEVAQAATIGAADVHALVRAYAQQHGVPHSLAHRVVMRESRYNPRVMGRGHFGLLQISLPTARQMGYSGAPAGLLEAKTNLAYGMPYLANAWLVSGRNEARAIALYSRGYYYEAKRKGLVRALRTASSAPVDAERGAELAVNP